MSYNSKYTGQEVENLLDQVKNGEVGGGRSAYPMVNHGTNDTTFELTPNTFHVWGEVAELNLTFGGSSEPTVAEEYLFQFISGNTPTTLVLPSVPYCANGEYPIIVDNAIYQVSILSGCVSVLMFREPMHNLEINQLKLSVDGESITISSDYPVASDLEITHGNSHGTRTDIMKCGEQELIIYTGDIVEPDTAIISVTPSLDDQYKYLF